MKYEYLVHSMRIQISSEAYDRPIVFLRYKTLKNGKMYANESLKSDSKKKTSSTKPLLPTQYKTLQFNLNKVDSKNIKEFLQKFYFYTLK